MPNYVKNIITFNSSVEEIKNFVKSEKSDFDFNSIIPMPESLDIEESSYTTKGMEFFLTAMNPETLDYGYPKKSKMEFLSILEKIKKEYFYVTGNLTENEMRDFLTNKQILSLGKTALENFLNYGHATWYSWRIDNWDTKWNACEVEEYDNGFTFETAWSMPHNVLIELSKKFPNVTITQKWADEDIGHNCGYAKYKNGKELMIREENNYANPVRFANQVWNS